MKIRNKRRVPKPDESINQKDELDTIQQQARRMVFNITVNNISIILWWFKRQQARYNILSRIFQLYRGGQFYLMVEETGCTRCKPPTCVGVERYNLRVVITTDCTAIYKS